MSELKGTKTEANLMAAFAGESQARNKYTYFASKAKKEGFEQIAKLFEETANNEKEHAKLFFKFLKGGMVEINASYPAGIVGTTAENLLAAAMGEHEEWSHDYPMFADIAEKEGFKAIAVSFRKIAEVEAEHERRYRQLLERVEAEKVFNRDEEIEWQCRNCGYIHTGKTAPSVGNGVVVDGAGKVYQAPAVLAASGDPAGGNIARGTVIAVDAANHTCDGLL